MSRTAAARSVDLEPIDRLEEKVKMLVAMIGRLKADQARAAEENARLSRELEAARAQDRRFGGRPGRGRRAADGARVDSRPRVRHAGTARRTEPVEDHMPEPQVVSVEIRGQRYPIRSDLDANYVNGLATYVDEKMRAASESTPSGDSLRLAVLAALNIADELFRCQDVQQARRGALAERTEALERLVDAALAP